MMKAEVVSAKNKEKGDNFKLHFLPSGNIYRRYLGIHPASHPTYFTAWKEKKMLRLFRYFRKYWVDDVREQLPI